MAESFEYLNELATRPGGNVTYLELCDGSFSIPRPPRFSFGECTNDLMMRYYSESRVGPVGLYTANDIDVFGLATLLRGQTIILCDEIHMERGSLPDYRAEYNAVSSSIQTRTVAGQCVLFCGPGYRRYGHWLVDFLPKLFVLNAAGYDLMKLRYLVPEDAPSFGFDIMDVFGLTEDKRIVYNQQSERVEVEELLIPTMARTNSRTSPLFGEAARFIASLAWQRHDKPEIAGKGRRIFVSRKDARDFRRLVNRDRIEQIATEAGFAVICPEQLPLMDQFVLFRDAQQVIGEYGSALHASIFSAAATTVCALRGNGSPVAGFLQSAIGEALCQPTGYVFGTTMEGDPSQHFDLSENAFRTCLNLIFGGMPLA